MRRIVILSVAATLAVAVLTVPASSAASKTPFTADAAIADVIGGEEKPSGESDIIHIKGRTFVFDVTGDLTGSMTAVTDFHIRLATGDATLTATVVLATQQGRWEGRARGTLVGGFVDSITIVGHGADGTKVMSTMTQTGPGLFEMHGVILDPHG